MSDSFTNYNFLIFDCDGVLFDSNKVKTQGFRFALKEYRKEEVEKLITFHQKYGGISRYKKFDYFFSEILNLEQYKKNYDDSLLAFNSYMEKELFNVNFVEGVRSFIHYCWKNQINLYIVSGGDHLELNRLIEKKKINKYFSMILGSPISKSENLEKVLLCEKSRNGIFIGDSRVDYFCAREQDLDFMFVEQFSEDKMFFKEQKLTIHKRIYNFTDKNLYP